MNQFAALLLEYRVLPAIAAPLAAILIVLVERRTVKLYALAFQYAMVAWLVVSPLPLESAAAKLVAGWISVIILYWGAARSTEPLDVNGAAVGLPRGRVFRITAVLLVVIGTLGVSSEAWIPIDALDQYVQRAAMLLLVLGTLGIGLYIDALQVGVGLLTIISGFEIIYSSVEPSLAIVALLALVHLGIALIISYFEMIQADNSEGALAER
jgi:hypothetical protein